MTNNKKPFTDYKTYNDEDIRTAYKNGWNDRLVQCVSWLTKDNETLAGMMEEALRSTQTGIFRYDDEVNN